MNSTMWIIIGVVVLSVLLPLLLGHTKRIGRHDPYFQWFHSGGKLLKDYDEEQRMIDDYMK